MPGANLGEHASLGACVHTAVKRGVRSYPTGPRAFFAASLARYLKDGDFVAFLSYYRSPAGVGNATTRARHDFRCRLHYFLALPEGYAEQLAAPSVTEDDEPLEPLHLLELCQDVLPEMMCGLVQLGWGNL